jgi:two-component system, cell cycle response regulator
MRRAQAVSAVVLALGLAVIAAITLLQQRSDASRHAELQLAGVKTELTQLQTAPFRANPKIGGSPVKAGRAMRTGKRRITDTLAELQRQSPPPALSQLEAPLQADFGALDQIYAIGISGTGYGRRADLLGGVSGRAADRAVGLLDAAASDYGKRAARAHTRATVGSATAILLLLVAFAFFYRRSVRTGRRAQLLAQENERLLAASREEALTDALTGLGNRRALINDLSAQLARTRVDDQLLLALFDLDGFKQYNDTFGHPAGDALLARLGERYEASAAGLATVYRMGGDEFCLLSTAGASEGDAMVRRAAAALSESGDAFEVTCSYGIARLPADASSVAEALRLADQRMYEQKAGRSSASRQSTDVLLQVLSERTPDLDEHLSGVARLAARAAQELGLSDHEVKRIRLAAELHDVGKTAIPETILNKPGPLNEDEWAFMRRHTIIGERIIRAAPSLANVADLVRASHERYDGGGYPDALKGPAIPLGASIVAVCDAYDAMVCDRPYREAMPVADALAELRRCSGAQFHPDVVAAFCSIADELEAVSSRAA